MKTSQRKITSKNLNIKIDPTKTFSLPKEKMSELTTFYKNHFIAQIYLFDSKQIGTANKISMF